MGLGDANKIDRKYGQQKPHPCFSVPKNRPLRSPGESTGNKSLSSHVCDCGVMLAPSAAELIFVCSLQSLNILTKSSPVGTADLQAGPN
jgi:hypothetical protein